MRMMLYLCSSSLNLGMLACRKGRTKGRTGKVVTT